MEAITSTEGRFRPRQPHDLDELAREAALAVKQAS